MDEKIGFVILHYNVIQETKNCVESIIEKIDTINYEIIIVDNGSINGTGEKLEKEYKEKNNIHVLKNKENLGFARGNNEGYRFAKDRLKCKYIVMMNNDTKIISDNWYKKILEEYKKNEFAVMGPKIQVKNGRINPVQKSLLPSNRQIIDSIIVSRIKYILVWCRLQKLYDKFDKILLKKIEKNTLDDVDQKRENVILHGCCWIFSPKFVNLFDGINDRTFLYCEEELLYLQVIKNELKIVYNPELILYHEEDVATNAINRKDRDKKLFFYRNLIKSRKILYDEINKWKREEKKEKAIKDKKIRN